MQNALKTGIKTKKPLYIFIITHRGRKGKELSLKIRIIHLKCIITYHLILSSR